MTGKWRGKGRRYGKKCGVTQGNSQLTVPKDKVCECVTNRKVKVAEAKGDSRNVMSEWKPRHGAKSYTIKQHAFTSRFLHQWACQDVAHTGLRSLWFNSIRPSMLECTSTWRKNTLWSHMAVIALGRVGIANDTVSSWEGVNIYIPPENWPSQAGHLTPRSSKGHLEIVALMISSLT